MELHKTIALFFLLCYLISTTVVVASTGCFTSACSKDEPLIRFPFRLRNYQSLDCGYPGFNLFCDALNRTIIRLPGSPGEFTIEAINYSTQELWLNDRNNCLPQLLLNLNLSSSPFLGVYYQDFTLFNCSFDHTTLKLNPIGCLSGSNYTVYATSSMRGFDLLSKSNCKSIGTLPVPVQWPFFEQVVSSDLSGDILLTWDNPDCRICASRGGRCSLKRTPFNREIICENSRGIGKISKHSLYINFPHIISDCRFPPLLPKWESLLTAPFTFTCPYLKRFTILPKYSYELMFILSFW